MKNSISLMVFCICMSAFAARAADDAAAQPDQLGSCAKGAAGKQGAELKTYMQGCVAAKATTAEAKAKELKSRRAACLQQAQAKSGREHIEFMAACMKGDAASAPATAGSAAAAAPAASN